MLKMHKAYPVTGTVCMGAAVKIPGTLVYEASRPESRNRATTHIGHPAGVIAIDACVEMAAGGLRPSQATLGRTARRLMKGYAFVPRTTLHVMN